MFGLLKKPVYLKNCKISGHIKQLLRVAIILKLKKFVLFFSKFVGKCYGVSASTVPREQSVLGL